MGSSLAEIYELIHTNLLVTLCIKCVTEEGRINRIADEDLDAIAKLCMYICRA